MRTFLSNVQFTLRLIRRSPGFYALVLALLAAGIGATTTMFSVAESVLLKPLPYAAPEDLTDIVRVDPQFPHAPSSTADFLDWRAQGTAFEQMAAVNGAPLSLSFDGALPVSVAGAEVSADFFAMLRIAPLLGRLLGPADDRPGSPLVAVIAAQLWQTKLGADPNVVGRTITLNSRPYTVVGVAPRVSRSRRARTGTSRSGHLCSARAHRTRTRTRFRPSGGVTTSRSWDGSAMAFRSPKRKPR